MKKISQILKENIFGSFFPVSCIGCGADDIFVCSVCLDKVKIRNFNDSWEKLNCDDFIDRVFIAGWYEDKIVKEMILNAKYHGQRKFADFLAQILVKFIRQIDLFSYLGQAAVLLPMPLHPRRLRERGYNQSFLLANELSLAFDIPLESNAAQRKKYTKHQTGLPARQRAENLRGAFSLNPKVKILPREILLVDDVVTTGASLNELARTLKNAGVAKVYALVVAKN